MSARVKVQSYAFDAALSSAYYDLVVELQASDPLQIVPMRGPFLARFDTNFPFYSAPGNRHCHFVARASGRVVGHVSALLNAALCDDDGSTPGLVGNFACVDEYAVVAALLDAATGWLRDAGLQHAWGPVDYDIWHAYRFMIEGFTEDAFYGEPRNPPWYPAYFERYGFHAWRRWLSRETRGRVALDAGIAGLAGHHAEVFASGYHSVPINLDNSWQLAALHQLVEAALADFPGVTQLSQAAFAESLADYMRLVDPRFVTLLCAPDGTPCAFAIAYPDVSPALRAVRGCNGWLERLRFAWLRRDCSRVLFYLLGVKPDSAHSRRGLGSALFYEVMQKILAAGYDQVLFALLVESGVARLLSPAEAAAAQRRYVLYRINLK